MDRAGGAGFIAGSLLTPVIVRRVRPPLVVAAGLVLAAVGFGLIATVTVDSGLAVIVTGSIVFALGLAAVATLATDLIVGTAPPERAGAASALSETGAEFGGAFGIAILGSIGTAVYRAQLSDAMPAGVGPKTAEAAQDTLGGALVAAGHLPRSVGSELLVVAREAFTRGLRLAVIVAAIIAGAMAVLVLALLKRVRPSPAVGAELASADRSIAGS